MNSLHQIAARSLAQRVSELKKIIAEVEQGKDFALLISLRTFGYERADGFLLKTPKLVMSLGLGGDIHPDDEFSFDEEDVICYHILLDGEEVILPLQGEDKRILEAIHHRLQAIFER